MYWKKIGEISRNLGSTLEDSGIVETMTMHGSYVSPPLATRAGDALTS